jgi:hypothetical protein
VKNPATSHLASVTLGTVFFVVTTGDNARTFHTANFKGSSSSGNRVATNRTNRRDDSKYEGMLNDRAKIRCDVARYDPRLAAM